MLHYRALTTSPKKSQREEALDEPSERTASAAVVTLAPACYVAGLEPQRCTCFVNLDLWADRPRTGRTEKGVFRGVLVHLSKTSLPTGKDKHILTSNITVLETLMLNAGTV